MSTLSARLWFFFLLSLFCIGCNVSALFLVSPVNAETYVGAMIGGAFPEFTDVRDGQGARYQDLSIKNSIAGGVKLGHFFSDVKWLGVEAEFFGTSPKFKTQTAPSIGPGPSLSVPEANLEVLTLAFNAILRYPGERFQPYAGAGLGIFFADLRTQGAQADNAVPGLNILAGARYFLTDQFALFGEYKYNQASFTFDRAVSTPGGGTTSLSGDYSAHLFMAGVSVHFK